MPRLALLMLSAVLLTACASAPKGPMACPTPAQLPPMVKIPQSALEHSFTGTISNFSEGKLERQTDSVTP